MMMLLFFIASAIIGIMKTGTNHRNNTMDNLC
jgi:hypothetical protein